MKVRIGFVSNSSSSSFLLISNNIGFVNKNINESDYDKKYEICYSKFLKKEFGDDFELKVKNKEYACVEIDIPYGDEDSITNIVNFFGGDSKIIYYDCYIEDEDD